MAVIDRTSTSTLDPIREKVAAGERLDLEDGLALMESDDILGLGELADLARRKRGGDVGALKMGVLVPLTGPLATPGIDMVDGFKLYWEQVNHQAGGKVADRKSVV